MKAKILLVAMMAASASASAEDAWSVKAVEAQTVLAVKVAQGEYAPAFGKLVEHYLRRKVDVVFPQMTIEAAPDSFAAIGFRGEGAPAGDVQVLTLPAATVAAAVHRGPYADLSQSIGRLVSAAQAKECVPDLAKKLRLLHPNSPDNTLAADLITEIQLPVSGC